MQTVIDNGNGVKTTVALQDGALITGTTQDCTPILEHAKAMHNAGMFGTSEMRFVATIPDVVIERYCNENNITFHEYCSNIEHARRLLNDPDLSGFRVWKGRV